MNPHRVKSGVSAGQDGASREALRGGPSLCCCGPDKSTPSDAANAGLLPPEPSKGALRSLPSFISFMTALESVGFKLKAPTPPDAVVLPLLRMLKLPSASSAVRFDIVSGQVFIDSLKARRLLILFGGF